MAEEISIGLTRDQALVLFDWLARSSDAGEPAAFADQAEQRALWDVEAMLESVLVEPFRDDYREVLEGARRRLRVANE